VHADLFGVGWRAVFLVNIPSGWRPDRSRGAPAEARASHATCGSTCGTVLAGAAMLLVVYPLVQGATSTGGLIFFLLAASIPALGLFVWQQRAASASTCPADHAEPAARGRSWPGRVILLFFAGMIGLMLTFMLTCSSLGYSALHAGRRSPPWSLAPPSRRPRSALLARATAGT